MAPENLATDIYYALKNNGADIGNYSLHIIQQVLDEHEINTLPQSAPKQYLLSITAEENLPVQTENALIELVKDGIIHSLITEYLNWHPTDLRMASVKSFIESGKISGSIYLAIKAIAKEYAAQSAPKAVSAEEIYKTAIKKILSIQNEEFDIKVFDISENSATSIGQMLFEINNICYKALDESQQLQSQQKDFKYFSDWWNTLKPQYRTPEIIFDHFKIYQSYFKKEEDKINDEELFKWVNYPEYKPNKQAEYIVNHRGEIRTIVFSEVENSPINEMWEGVIKWLKPLQKGYSEDKIGKAIEVITKEKSACQNTICCADENKDMVYAMNNQIGAFDICLKHLQSL